MKVWVLAFQKGKKALYVNVGTYGVPYTTKSMLFAKRHQTKKQAYETKANLPFQFLTCEPRQIEVTKVKEGEQ